jgi:hypothetical protein
MNSDAVDLVVINLKVLAGLKETDRLITRNSAFEVQETGWIQTISRRWNGDTRWSNFSEIKKLVEDALRILGAYCAHAFGTATAAAPLPKPDNAIESVQSLVAELTSAAAGLTVLKATYATDPRMIANLDVLLQKLHCEVLRAQNSIFTHIPEVAAHQSPLEPPSQSTAPRAPTAPPCGASLPAPPAQQGGGKARQKQDQTT